MNFNQKLEAAVKETQSCLCVGLDPNVDRIPSSIKEKYHNREKQVIKFLTEIIDITANYCAAYKPNLGFFEALGTQGLQVFQEVVNYIPDDKIIIADVKRGDISSTAEHYAKAYFEQFNADAVTVNPLMGFETLDPFLHYAGKGIYVLALTSNSGASDFLNRPFLDFNSMAEYIAENLAIYNEKSVSHIGMVVGATKAAKLTAVIKHHPKSSLLIPGIGAQGGAVDDLAPALENHPGIPLINSSRSVLYAGGHTKNWKKAVNEYTKKLQNNLLPITKRYV